VVADATPPPAPPPPAEADKPKRETRTETARPKDPPKADPPPPPPPPIEKATKAKAGCDPVLDFDCKPSGGGGKEPAKAAGKETLEKGDILPVVRDNLPKVKACGAKSGATGTVKMSWKIGKDGKPTDVAIADAKWGGTPVGNCVVGVVKAMRFPAYSGKAPPPVSIPLPLQ
jgi:hypothetical protein